MPAAAQREAQASLEKLTAYVEREDYRGYDPYDALNSPVARALSFGRKYPRIAWIQLLKRLPVNLRPLLLVRKQLNAKGLGLFLWGYAKLFRATGEERYLERIESLLELLSETRSSGISGNGWGYPFDWQSRAFFVPRGTPTIVNSSFVGHALLDTYRYTGSERALELAVPIQSFIVRDLNRTEGDGELCLSYTPIDRTVVHNANLLGASLLARLEEHHPDAEARAVTEQALRFTLDRQRGDGSWWYADTSFQQWIDSFHTGFNLHCLSYLGECGYDVEDAYERGLAFYCANFFEPDGTAKYFHDRREPEDIHSYAQAVVLLSREASRHNGLRDRVLRRMIESFQDPRGYFYFQKRTLMVRIPYMRWSQAWAFHALSEVLLEGHDSC